MTASRASAVRGRLGSRESWLAALGFTLLGGVMFAPLLSRLSGSLWSDTGDGVQFIWSYITIPRSISEGRNPFVTNEIMFPVGAHTTFNTNVPIVSVFAGMLSWLIGLSAASVVIGFGTVVLTGLAAYLLAREIGLSYLVSVCIGAVLEFLPYRSFRTISHLNLIHIELLLFGLLLLVRLHNKPSGRRAAMFGLLMGITFLTDLTYTVFLIVAAGVFAIAHWRSTFTRSGLARWGIAVGVTLVVSLPLLLPLASDLSMSELPPPKGLGNAEFYSADVFGWVTPNPDNPLWGVDDPWVVQTINSSEHTAYTGIVMIALAILGIFTKNKSRRVWIALVAVFGVMALGPYLQVWGNQARMFGNIIPLPYLIVHEIPVFNISRVPGRYGVMVSIGLVLLAGFALDFLRKRRPRVGLAVCVACTLLTLVEFVPSRDLSPMSNRVPSPYKAMDRSPASGAILDVPLQWRDGFGVYGDTKAARDNTIFMYYAASIDRPMSGGTVSRITDERLARLRSKKVYKELLILQGDMQLEPGWQPTFTRQDLKTLGIAFVVYHADRPMPAALAHINTLGLREFATDGTITAYRV